MTEEKSNTTIPNERTNEDIYSLTASCNDVIKDSILKADRIINDAKYEVVLVSISGGSDSDDILDICWHVDRNKKCKYIWFDTGLEYQATKEHLKYLESKYHINIIREKAIKPIPVSCKEFGQPFLSKRVSDYVTRLQKHGFQWEDEPFEVLYKKYPKCRSALRWWCNMWDNKGEKSSQFNINRNAYLKEFLISNHPTFSISNKCCDYAKKNVAHQAIKQYDAQLNIIGIRKAEGGVRASAYKRCFDEGDGVDNLRPIFWWNNDDKVEYENTQNVVHSDCYSVYGLPRTGCVGCPYARDLEGELEVIEKYEPRLYRAVTNVFSDSYEYRKKYKEFVKEMKTKGIKPRKD